MSIEEPNKAQMELLASISFPDEEWTRDIIWLKRLDAVSHERKQREANELFNKAISENNLFSKKEKHFRLISYDDNVWDSQRLNKKKVNPDE